MDESQEEIRFSSTGPSRELRGIVHRPADRPRGSLVVTHGRSNDMRNAFVKRIAEAAAAWGLFALRFNFRYVDEKSAASRDLRIEEDDLRGAIRFLRNAAGAAPLFIAGKSMGARVCARASSDPDVAGMIALGYPLHPQFRPQVRNPPEWPLIAKPALFVQGDQDPFCDLSRLREDLGRLPEGHDLVVIHHAGHSFEPRGENRDTFPEVWDAVRTWIEARISAR